MRYIFALLCLLALACLFAAHATAAQFTLTWKDNSTNEAGFTIERAPGLDPAASEFVPVANVAANVTTYVDAGLPPETSFAYRLCAYNAAGKSGYSNTAAGTTPPPAPAAPGAPVLTSPPAYVPPVPTVTLQPGESALIVAASP